MEGKIMKKKIIGSIFIFWGSAIICGYVIKKIRDKYQCEIANKNKTIKKFKTYYMLYDEWLCAKQLGFNMENWFIERGYTKIAIYGMGGLGTRLLKELENGSVEVVYGIDQSCYGEYESFKIYQPNNILPKVDAIIVTSVSAYLDIKEKLSQSVSCPIINIENCIYDV